MRCKVKVKKHQLDYFRKLARNCSLEIQAYLVGKVVSPKLTVIDYFAYTDSYFIQDKDGVSWDLYKYNLAKEKAESKGMRIVGQIHSHPEWDAVLSPKDYKNLIEEGHRISGLCSTNGRKTKVRFWTPESSLSCEIEYINGDKKRGANPEISVVENF